MTDKERWEMVRGAIEHEDLLTNHRLTWLLTAQGFLVGAFFVSQNFVYQLKNPLSQALAELALAIVFFGGIRLCMIVGVAVALASEQIYHLQEWSRQSIHKYPPRKPQMKKTPWLARIVLWLSFFVILGDIISYIYRLQPREYLFANYSVNLSLSRAFTTLSYAVFIIYVITAFLIGLYTKERPRKPFHRAYGVLAWWYFTTPPFFEWPVSTIGPTPPVLGQFEVPRMLSVRWIPAIFMFLNLIFMSICLSLCWEYSEKVKGDNAFETAPLYVKSIKFSENAGQPSFEIQFEVSGHENKGLSIEALNRSAEFDRVIEKLRSKIKIGTTSGPMVPGTGKSIESDPVPPQNSGTQITPVSSSSTIESNKNPAPPRPIEKTQATENDHTPTPHTDRIQSRSQSTPVP